MSSSNFKINILLGLIIFCQQANAQINTREVPVGFKHNFNREQIPEIVMPAVDIVKLQEEDEKEKEYNLPPRFGYKHSVDLNLLDEGFWYTLENGDKLCQLSIVCPNALSVNLLYDKFWLPDGAKFFIYSNDHKHSIGAFTSLNNKGSRNDMQGFATGLVYGDRVTLEYFLPKDVKETGSISISGIVHGYRYIMPEYGYGNVPGNNPNYNLGFNQSGNCQVNINCPEGNNWQKEKRAVVLILVSGVRWCSGSLINNPSNDFTPYFLTANHCLQDGAGFNGNDGDAEKNPTLNHWTFYWNYELPTNLNNCNYNGSNPSEPLAYSTVGAQILANANTSVSDFALLLLTENPVYFSNYSPSYSPSYLGWDRTGNSGTTGGDGIHHPRGDVKKIATHEQNPYTINVGSGIGNYWQLSWMQTQNGHSITEGGSSGSPLINNDHRVIGQLFGTIYGGDCSAPGYKDSVYGKFSVSWSGNSPNNNYRQLQPWLDPTNTVSVLNGVSYCLLPVYNYVNQTVFNNTTVTNICGDINVQNVIVKNGSKLTLDATENVILNADFEIELGASLEIK